MRRTLPHLAETVRLQIWLVPMALAIVSATAAIVIVTIEDQTDSLGLPLRIDQLGAQGILSAISSAMISFTALVFSVTMLVLQQASSQLSPRVMRTFLRDRFNQVVLGLFVATFVFALIVLITISPRFVPQIAVIVSLGLVLVAVVAFVLYIDHIANAIRASSVIESIGDETDDVIKRLYEERTEGTDVPDVRLPEVADVVRSPHESGYVTVLDEEKLRDAATEADVCIEVLVRVGDYVVHGEPVYAIRGSGGAPLDRDEANDAIEVGPERSMSQDPLFGFRQLTDIALRALSPSTNDPTTASQAVNRVHALLRSIMGRQTSGPMVTSDESGTVRVVVPGPAWADFVAAAVDEVHGAGREMPQVLETLRGMLGNLAADAGPDRLPAIRRALTRLDGHAAESETA